MEGGNQVDEIVFGYRKLLDLISEEEQQAVCCIQGDLLEMYKNVLLKEREKIEQQIQVLQHY